MNNKKVFRILLALLIITPISVYAENQNDDEKLQNIDETNTIEENTNKQNNEENNNETKLLEEKILNEEPLTEEEKENFDINKDEKVDIKDLVSFDNFEKGEIASGETTNSSLKIKTERKGEIISYNVYLKTDGAVQSFMFDIEKTNNLKVLSIETKEDIKFNDKNAKIRFIGLGKFINNDLLATIYYELTNYNKGIINLKNGMIVYDNGKYKENIKYKNIFKLPKKIIATVNEKKSYITNNNYNNYNYYKLNNIKQKKSIKNKTKTEKEKTKKEKKQNKKEKQNKKNIVKIAIIVLLGALIIYLLNNENETKENKEEKE